MPVGTTASIPPQVTLRARVAPILSTRPLGLLRVRAATTPATPPSVPVLMQRATIDATPPPTPPSLPVPMQRAIVAPTPQPAEALTPMAISVTTRPWAIVPTPAATR